jgi:hypothetical protein
VLDTDEAALAVRECLGMLSPSNLPIDDLGKTDSNPSTDHTEGVWISFSQAYSMTGLSYSHISKLCKTGKVRFMGKRRGRKVHSGDVSRHMAKSLRQV